MVSQENLEYVILVDEKNNQVGTCEKILAHEKGLLHRAFSILIFNNEGELLIQERANEKYHWPVFWANTCCSHPRPGENYKKATSRKLKQEMGFDCSLVEDISFIYRAEFENGLIEHEHDTVFVGRYNGIIIPNKKEVKAYDWVNSSYLKKDMKENSKKYAPWFKIILDKF